MTRTYTREEPLYLALSMAREAAKDEPSRAQSLVVTKLEEACLWNDVVRKSLDLDPLGLDWEQ